MYRRAVYALLARRRRVRTESRGHAHTTDG
jgi:hypothetical protein